MHRVLSVQTSRSENNESSEFVSKRLCCSFLFTVAFFTIIGGFLLGRYTSNRTVFLHSRNQMKIILSKVLILQQNITNTFHNLNTNCSCGGSVYYTEEKKCNRSYTSDPYRRGGLISDIQNDLQTINGTLDVMITCLND